jgi:CheY-like chemotaxis protein
MPRDIEKGLEAGFFRYLTKPIRVNEFMDTLAIAFAHATATQPQGFAAMRDLQRQHDVV